MIDVFPTSFKRKRNKAYTVNGALSLVIDTVILLMVSRVTLDGSFRLSRRNPGLLNKVTARNHRLKATLETLGRSGRKSINK